MPITSRDRGFVGRQREIDALTGYLSAAGGGEGGVVLVAGEPGIGKTRLLAELVARGRAGGWTALGGRAYDSEGMPPYLPFVEALRAYMRDYSPGGEPAPFSPPAELVVLLPELRERLAGLPPRPPLSPDQERYHLFEAVCDSLDGIARRGETGLLLVLDDLHWADAPTLQLLQHLGRRLAGVPLLVVIAYRTIDVDQSPAFTATLAALAREGARAPLVLAPLALEETAALAAGIAGSGVAAAVATAIQRATEGNPFFIGEVVRDLQAQGRDFNDIDAAGGDFPVPELVRQVIAARLARLHATTHELLQHGAVLGDGFSFEVVCAASGQQDDGALAAIEEALAAGVLAEERDTYQFTHALIRQTVYDTLSAARRRRLHQRVAEAIERVHTGDLTVHSAALATHYRLAGAAGDPHKVLTYSLAAADAAAAMFAWEEVVTHRQAALDLVDTHPDARLLDESGRCELLLALGEAQTQAGADTPANRTFERAAGVARQLGAVGLFARAALGHGESGDIPGRTNQATVTLVEEALGSLAPDQTAPRVRLFAALAAALFWSPDPRKLVYSSEALALARQSGDTRLLMSTLAARRWVLHSAREFTDERWTLATEILQLAEACGDRAHAEVGLVWRVLDLMEQGEIHQARAAVAAHTRLADDLRLPLARYKSLVYQVMLALSDGRFDESELLMRRAEALRQRLPDLNRISIPGQLVALRRDRGQLGDPEVARVVSYYAALRAGVPLWRILPAYVAAELGREQEVRSLWESLAMNDFQDALGSSYSLPAVTLLAEICTHVTDRPRAAVLYDLLFPHAGVNAMPFAGFASYGAVAHYLGLLARTLGRRPMALRHFSDALAMHERMEARPHLAHTCREYAVTLLGGPPGAVLTEETAMARALLTRARALYEELGMMSFATRTRDLLEDPRPVGAHRSPLAHPNGLTEREVEVMRLIAAGMSNAAIASALVLSVRTVERHISNIYEKIGVSGRAARAAAAAYGLTHNLIAAVESGRS